MVKILGKELLTDDSQKAIKEQIHEDWILRLIKKFGAKMVGMKVLLTMFVLLFPALFGISVLGIMAIVDIEIMLYFQSYLVEEMIFAWVRLIIGFGVLPILSLTLFFGVSWWAAQRFKDVEVWRLNIRNSSASVSGLLDLIIKRPTPMRQIEKSRFPKGLGVYLSDEIEAMHKPTDTDDLQKRVDEHIKKSFEPKAKKPILEKVSKVKKLKGAASKLERSKLSKWSMRFLKIAIAIAVAVSIQITLLHFFSFDLLGTIIAFLYSIPTYFGLGTIPSPLTPSPSKKDKKDNGDDENGDTAGAIKAFESAVAHLDLSTEEGRQEYIKRLINLEASHQMLQKIVTKMGLRGWVLEAEEAIKKARRLKPTEYLGQIPVYCSDVRNDEPFVIVFPTDMSASLGEPQHTQIMTPEGLWTATVPLYVIGGIMVDIYPLYNHQSGKKIDTTVVQVTYCAWLDKVQAHGLCLYDFGFPLFGAQLSKDAKDKLDEEDKENDSTQQPPEYGATEYLKDVKTSTDSFLSNQLVLLLHKSLMAFKDIWPKLVYFMYGEATIRQEMAASIVEEQNDLGKGWGKSIKESVFSRIPMWVQVAIIFSFTLLIGLIIVFVVAG